MGIKERCAKRVFSGDRADTGGHMCTKPAKFEHGGKKWCSTHYPPNVEKRNAVNNARWAAADAASQYKYALLDALDARDADVAALQKTLKECSVYLDPAEMRTDELRDEISYLLKAPNPGQGLLAENARLRERLKAAEAILEVAPSNAIDVNMGNPELLTTACLATLPSTPRRRKPMPEHKLTLADLEAVGLMQWGRVGRKTVEHVVGMKQALAEALGVIEAAKGHAEYCGSEQPGDCSLCDNLAAFRRNWPGLMKEKGEER